MINRPCPRRSRGPNPPPPPSLAQGASWGPEEKTFRPILCAKEDLQQRSVRIAIPPHPGSRK